jgi:hypothetical protein
MDEIIKRISERLADQSSRRGFFSKMGKVVLGLTALAGGEGLFAQAAEAAPGCCTGGATCPSSSSCPAGSHVTYTWRCGRHNGHYTVCNDCHNSTTGKLVCVYATSH